MTESAAVGGRMLLRNTGFNMLGHILPLLVAVVALPQIVHGLGAERFGILAIAWVIVNHLGEIGFGRATTKFAAEVIGRDEARLPGIVWGTTAIQLAFGLAGGLVLGLTAPALVRRVFDIPAALEREALVSMWLVAVVFPAVVVASAMRGVLEAAQRFDLVNAVRIPVSIANYLLPLAALLVGWSLPGVLVLLLLGRVATTVAFYVLVVRLFPVVRRIRLDDTDWRALIGFGSWTTISGIISPVLIYLDRFMLGALVTMGAVAYYAAPFELVARMLLIPASLVATLFPALSTLVSQREWKRVDGLVARSVKYVLLTMGAIAIALAAGAHDLLRLWLGPEFARESTLALQILAAGVLVNAIAYIPYSLLQGMGRPDLTAKFHLIELPIQVVLVWLCVGRWGITGAAVAWSLRVAVDAALLFGALARLRGLSARAFLEERVPQTALLLIAFGALTTGATSWAPVLWLRVAVVGLGLLGLSAALWQFALATADRAWIARLVRFGARRAEA